MMSDHEPFTADETEHSEAGRIRGIILEAITLRAGDTAVHPRLLEGIEVAARVIAAAQLDDLERDRRLLGLWAEGYVAGGYNVTRELGGDALAAVGYHHAMHALGHLTEDPLARAQIIERLVHHWTTGEQAPAERVDIHGMAHRNPEAEE